MFKSALETLFFGCGSKARNGRLRRCFARRLSVEQLEDRRVLANFTVTSLADAAVSGPGSAPGTLRQAIYDANNTEGDDVIKFDVGLAGAVNLSVVGDSALGPSALLVTSTITIRGNASGITISRSVAAAEMRLFRVTVGGNLTLESLSMSQGIVRGTHSSTPGEDGGDAGGGAIFSQGVVNIFASTLYNNQALGGNAGAGGRAGAGLGGAIHSADGMLSLTNATLSGNSAIVGTGAIVPSSFGGAVYTKNGSLKVYNSTITNNVSTTGRGVFMGTINGTATGEIQSSIIAQSDAQISVRDFLTAPEVNGQITVTGSNNLIRIQGDFSFITISTDDPLLGPLSNNGGPVMTHALPANSPAVNLGNNSLNLESDQRGAAFARVVGGSADIGAFELQAVLGPLLPGDYNGNHVVDGADYVVWRKTFAASVPQYSGADGSGNSFIDAADYGVWRSNLGATGAAAASSSSTAVVAESAQAVTVQPAERKVANLSREFLLPAVSTVHSTPAKAKVSSVSNFDRMRASNLRLVEIAPKESRALRNGEVHLAQSRSDSADLNQDVPCDARVADAVWASWPGIARFGA